MKLTDQVLTGWLVFIRHNLGHEEVPIFIPSQVRVELLDHGWVRVEPLSENTYDLHVTDAGTLVSDLAAPEWGIDPIVMVGADE